MAFSIRRRGVFLCAKRGENRAFQKLFFFLAYLLEKVLTNQASADKLDISRDERHKHGNETMKNAEQNHKAEVVHFCKSLTMDELREFITKSIIDGNDCEAIWAYQYRESCK